MAEAPQFDPSKPFEVLDAPAFDPSKPFETVPSSLAEAAKTGLRNIPSSAGRFAKDIVQPFIHPIQTAESLGNLGRGVMEKVANYLGVSGVPTEHIKYADAVGRFLMDRYGSEEAIKSTLANDPVGMAADVSMVLSGGGTAAARLPGIAGRVGEVAATAGRVTNPLNIAGKAVGAASQLAPLVIGETTGVGAPALRTAARAGYQGGPAAQSLTEHMRGTADIGEAVDEARAAVRQMRQQRGADYRAGMAGVRQDTTVLNFNDVDTAINNMAGVKTYRGQTGRGPPQNLSPKTDEIWRDMTNAVYEWKQLDPAEFHTPEGMDALKQQLGSIRDSTQYGTPERRVADDIYHAVRSTIVKQVPEYARVMEGYEQATDLIREMERTLSTNPKATVDTALRKLQSVLRNNVHTNYGQRARLVDYLVANGAPQLLEKLAGQSLSAWAPRGLSKLIGADILARIGSAKWLPLMSPRIMGELAYGGGRAAGVASPLTQLPWGTGANVLRAGGVDALAPGASNDPLR